MYILGNNVASQEEFDTHIANEKKEHMEFKESINVLEKELSNTVQLLSSRQEYLERKLYRQSLITALLFLSLVVSIFVI